MGGDAWSVGWRLPRAEPEAEVTQESQVLTRTIKPTRNDDRSGHANGPCCHVACRGLSISETRHLPSSVQGSKIQPSHFRSAPITHCFLGSLPQPLSWESAQRSEGRKESVSPRSLCHAPASEPSGARRKFFLRVADFPDLFLIWCSYFSLLGLTVRAYSDL